MRYAIALVLVCASAHAQVPTGSTSAQLALIDRYAELSELRVRYGEQHEAIAAKLAEIESLATSLRSAGPIDFAIAQRAVNERLSAARREMDTLSERYGPAHPQMQAALARRTALERALRSLRAQQLFLGQ
jgi:uncharacterized protein involved in exopolysaccharide biosynthesis